MDTPQGLADLLRPLSGCHRRAEHQVVQVVSKLRELSPLYEMAKEGIDISKVKWQTA